jgi:hypothetical protein
MTNKIIAMLYVLIYGALLVLCVFVTFTTSIGFWGVVGIAGFAWLTWHHLAVLHDAT